MSVLLGDTSVVSRQKKAEKIARIVADALAGRLARARCLDLGCGIGVIGSRLQQEARWVAGVEMERALLALAPATLPRAQGDAGHLPFGDQVFDLVICAQVYEHVADAAQLAAEVYRVLKPGGICFWSGPNRLWPYEFHYRAWLVHWLPRRWLAGALALLGRGELPLVTLYTCWRLRRLLASFDIHDYTPVLLSAPGRFPGAGIPRWFKHIPAPLFRCVACAVPNFNWIAVKPGEARTTP